MKIYLVRHGETEWNKEGRFQGILDIGLNETGLKQSFRLAERLSDAKFDKIYTSDLKRAYITAKNIAAKKSVEVIVDERLREINCGDWGALTWAEIKRDYQSEAKHWEEDSSNFAMPNGESYEELKNRVGAVFLEIAKRNENCVVVSHGAAIRAMMCYIYGLDISKRSGFDVYNTSLSIIEFNPESEKFRLVLFNSVEHLD